MNIMVFNVPAETGGALAILNDFYKEVVENEFKEINWYFVISRPNLKSTENIKVLKFEWIKKSWGHRLFFDNVTAPKLVKEYKIDKVLSFQNMTINRVNVEQTIYIHQSLPFVEHKIPIKQNFKLWLYQNVIGKKIITSIKKADKVIVQTKWMKEACVKKSEVKTDKVKVIPPKINMQAEDYFTVSEKSLKTFFYPAGALEYKNHKIIIEACKILKEKDCMDMEVIFTIKGDESNYFKELKSYCEKHKLPIRFKGYMERNEVYDMYTKSVLLFPSYIETFGLPLLEARMHGTIIIASNEPFSKEILKGYERSYYFNPFIPLELVRLIEKPLSYKGKNMQSKVSSEFQNKSIINFVLL